MFQSHVIEVNGTFIGAAVTTTGGFRFRAVHPRVEDLDGQVWPSLAELRRATGHLFITGRLSSTALLATKPDDKAVSYKRAAEPHAAMVTELPPHV